MSTDPTGLRLLEALVPLRDVVRRLVREAQRVRESAGRLPDANSPAMAEIAKQDAYAGRWSPGPLRLAQSVAGLCLDATEDHLETLCAVLDGCPGAERFRAPVYGQMPLARAAVECAGRASWLLEPGIPYERRASRAVGELLYSRWEQARASGDSSFYDTLKVEVAAECKARELKFKSQGGRVTVGERRLGNEAVVTHLFRRKPPRLPRTMYGYYSGGSHGVVWALLESVDLDAEPLSPLGANIRLIYADARRIALALAMAGEGYRVSVGDQWEYMGWGSPEWDAGVAELEANVLDLANSSTSN